MSPIKLTTDMGDWSTLPRRIRWATVSLVGAAAFVGLLSGLGAYSIAVVAAVLGGLGVVWAIVFDRRRPWWPDEPSVPVDPIGKNGVRKIALSAIVAIVFTSLVLAGVLPAS